jgi:hypothetical protein
MTKQFAKKSLAAALTTAALTFAVVTPAHAADQSNDRAASPERETASRQEYWLLEQRTASSLGARRLHG